MKIDGRMLDTDNRFFDYCRRKKIKNPFKENLDAFARRCSKEERDGYEVTIIREKTAEEEVWEKEWKKRRDEYLRLSHAFRLWDFHFWMNWEEFSWHCGFDKEFTDVSIYMPCDCADRQCNMTCAYFGGKCPREKEELKIPEILGFEGRWEFEDDYD